jgi:hypothetical protein
LREESLAFEARMLRWSAPDGGDDMHEFLLQDNVCMSFEIERVRAALLERARRHNEDADAPEHDHVHEMGSRLYHDSTGPTATYGTRKWDSTCERVSWQNEAVQPDDPAELVKSLHGSASGCFWLLEQWDLLNTRLESGGGFWVPSDKFKAIRLIGRQPIDAVDCRTVAEIFTASHALYRTGKPFDNLISDMGQGALDSYVNRVTGVWKDLVGPEDPKKARQILIDLVEENIQELEETLAEHFEKDREKARRTRDYNGFDESHGGQAIRRHWLRCRDSLDRGKKTYLKYKEEQGAAPRAGDGGGLVDRHCPLRAGDGGGLVDAQRPLKSGDGGKVGASDALACRGDVAFAERKTTMVEIHASDVLACGGFLPERVAPRGLVAEKGEMPSSKSEPEKLEILSSKFETFGGTGAARGAETLDDGAGSGDDFIVRGGSDSLSAVVVSGSSGECPLTPALSRRERESDAVGAVVVSGSSGECPLTPALSRRERESGALGAEDATGVRGDLTTAHEGTDGTNVTNEADFYDDVRILQTHKIVDVTVDSGDVSGLDNLRTKPESGGEVAGAPGCDGTGGVRPPPPAAPPLQRGGALALGFACARSGGSSPTREEELLEMEQRIFKEIESLKSQGEPDGDLLKDLLAASADLHAFLEAFKPRSP